MNQAIGFLDPFSQFGYLVPALGTQPIVNTPAIAPPAVDEKKDISAPSSQSKPMSPYVYLGIAGVIGYLLLKK